MAINLKFDLMGNPEPPSIVLANRNGNKLGQLNVDAKSIDVKDLLETSEFTFTLNKYVDGKLTNLWDKVLDFKLVYCPEWDLWYGIKVELDEATETVKTVFCTQLGQEELSQIKVYNTEINTEADIARDDYKISILYDENDKDASILHRVMSKAPHYSIAYIDESLKRIQKSFSFDDASICDVFDEIEEEVGCLVVYNSHSDKNGMPKRDISIYDLLQNCKNPSCKHRGEFTDKCPKCGGTDIDYGYGEDTTIFVTSDELATEGIQLVTDTDSVKNCFKLEAGDDLMTATVRNCNPNGSDYIWYFSDAVKEDMSKELVEAIEGYDTKYKEYYESHISNLDANLVSQYNALVNKYEQYYNTKSTCINCKHEGYFEDECPSCHSTNILTGRSLQTVDSPIIGYPALMNAYYNTIDLALYLESGLMPSIEMSKTSAKEQLDLLTSSSLSPVAVNVENINNVSLATANSAVLSMAKVVVKPTYKVQIKTSELSADKKLWQGQFIVTNYSDENDTASNGDDEYINVTINNDTKEFIQQKIEKALNKENTDDYSISGLFEKDYDDFCAELKKYALNPLNSFYDACDACLNILVEQGVGSPSEDSDENTNEDSDLYKELYEPYYNKSVAIANEIKLREDEIAIIKGVYNEGEENDEPDIDGLQTNIIDCRNAIQEELNFEKHLGESLWLEFCAYRREDKYSNSNYVSDGLNNAELFEKANEFIEVAEQEIFKSAELQHSISATLNNLLSHPKFKHLLKHFKTGNWIRVQVDGKVYKLRLLEYNFNYGDLENIPVEFSDVTKIKNGTTDVQDIFSKAASMASSYDSVQRQAKKGNVARSTIDQWIVDGLNTANVQIQSNDSEEVLLTKNGLLARSYSDITGTYSPEQLKITHNIMAYTDDNWQTVKQSIGKHEYKYFDQSEDKLVNTTGYGMNADFANAAVLCGSQMIGGDIYSNNYSKTVVDGKTITTGSHIDLEEGNFSLAGGKLSYDGGELIIVGNIEVTTAGRIGCWDINETSIYKGSAAFGDTNGMYFGTQGLSLGDDFKVEPSGLATMTNANVSGTITASDIIGNNIEGGTITGTKINGVDITAGSTLKVGEQKDEEGNVVGYNTWISEDGTLTADYANIGGEIRAAKGSIGGFTIETTETNEDGSKSGGWLYSGESIGSDKSIFLSATDMSGVVCNVNAKDWRVAVGNNFGITSDGTAYMSNCEITGGSLRMGAKEGNYHAWISSDGVLNASGANIEGTINAVSGSIAGWSINTNGIDKKVDEISVVGMYSGDNILYTSLVPSNDTSPIRFYAGCKTKTVTVDETTTSNPQTFTYSPEDCKTILNATYSVSNGGGGGSFSGIDTDALIFTWSGSVGATLTITYTYVASYPFVVLEDGSLYASNANIEGDIYADNGEIGGLKIDNGIKGYENNKETFSLTSGGLIVNSDLAKIQVGNFQTYYDKNAGNTYWQTNGALYIQGMESGEPITSIELMTDTTSGSKTVNILYDMVYTNNRAANTSDPDIFEFTFYTTDKIVRPVTYTVQYKTYYQFLGMSPAENGSGSFTFTLDATSPQTTCRLECIVSSMGISIQNPNGTWSDIITEDVSSVSFDTITQYYANNNIKIMGNLIPKTESNSTESEYSIGSTNNKWDTIYAKTGTIQTSDRNKKSDIQPLSDIYTQIFDALTPVSYKFTANNSNRTHTGLIAQDVKMAIENAGVTTQDFAGYCEWGDNDGVTGCGLRYEEFIALCVDQIQKLKKRVAELENK